MFGQVVRRQVSIATHHLDAFPSSHFLQYRKRDAGLDQVFFHIIFDGRSTEPGSAPKLLAELDEKLDAIGVGRIVDGVGRGVALDRDKNYDKVKRAYDAMVDGAGTRYE